MSAVPHALGVLRRRPVVGLLAALALALALVLGALALWARGEAARVAAGFGDVLVVTATLDPALDEPATQALLDKIAALPEVKTVRYVTPAQERARLAERVGADLLEGLDDDALPAPPTLDITLARGALSDAGLAAVGTTLTALRELSGVQSIPWRPDALRLALRFGDFAWLAGLVLALVALAVAAGAVHHLARAALADSHEERALLSAFGATARQLDLPAYAAALALGLLGVAFAVAQYAFADPNRVLAEDL
jgi:cell division transport system permease protein